MAKQQLISHLVRISNNLQYYLFNNTFILIRRVEFSTTISLSSGQYTDIKQRVVPVHQSQYCLLKSPISANRHR